MIYKEEIQKEINDMDAWIPVCEIEKRLNMPPTTLQKVLKGTRELPKKWDKVLEAYFMENKKREVKINDANKQTQEVKNITEEKPKTNYSIDTKNKEQMPKGLSVAKQLEWRMNH